MAFIEPLESRRLMSVTPAITAAQSALRVIRTQEALVVSDVKRLDTQGLADFAVIRADLKRLRTLGADSVVGAATERAGANLVKTLRKDEMAGGALVSRLAAKLVVDERALSAHPNNVLLQDRVSAVETQLNSAASTANTKFSTDANATTVDNDLNSLASDNSGDTQTGTDVTTAENDIATNLSDATSDAAALYGTDVSNLEALF